MIVVVAGSEAVISLVQFEKCHLKTIHLLELLQNQHHIYFPPHSFIHVKKKSQQIIVIKITTKCKYNT